MGAWDAWIGRTEIRQDLITPALVGRWLAMLDREGASDDAAPQGLHWCLCTPEAATSALGPDGHPLRDASPNSFLPPVPLPRRMWASSKLEFLYPLHRSEFVTRKSTILSITEKSGGSGSLVFVEVEHLTEGAKCVAIREVQTIVYRDAAAADAPLAPPPLGETGFDPSDWTKHRTFMPTETLLFRYSALTFNSHRIHYDLPYAQEMERYRGLVVHGPLMATLFLDTASQLWGNNGLSSFAFRGLSPAICGELLHLVMREISDDIELGIFADDGRAVMAATATRKIGHE